MEKCKIKAIQADLDTFKHIQAYSDIFRHNEACPGITQVYSKPCVILGYSEPWYIQNQRYTQNSSIFRTLAYSELC